MSIIDRQNQFSDAQAVTATAISTDVIDTGTPEQTLKDLGAGVPLYLVVTTDATFTAAGAATLDVSLESAENAEISTGAVVHFRTGPKALAALAGGNKVVVVALPSDEYKRYLGVRYTVATGPMTAGAVSAYLTRDPQAWRAYNAAVN